MIRAHLPLMKRNGKVGGVGKKILGWRVKGCAHGAWNKTLNRGGGVLGERKGEKNREVVVGEGHGWLGTRAWSGPDKRGCTPG